MPLPPFHRLQIFVPEGNRTSVAVPVDLQDQWTVRMLRRCADLFGGATAYGRGVGIWKERHGGTARVQWDRVTVIETWIDPGTHRLQPKLDALARSLSRMGRDLRQEVVGCMIDGRVRWVRRR